MDPEENESIVPSELSDAELDQQIAERGDETDLDENDETTTQSIDESKATKEETAPLKKEEDQSIQDKEAKKETVAATGKKPETPEKVPTPEELAAARQVILEKRKELFFHENKEKYKANREESDKGFEEHEALQRRQSVELGELRKKASEIDRVQADKQRREAEAVKQKAAPKKEPVSEILKRMPPEQAELAGRLIYEDMKPVEGMAIIQDFVESEREKESVQLTKEAETAEEEQYRKDEAIYKAAQEVAAAIPGWENEETRMAILNYGVANNYFTPEEVDILAFDPVNCPRVMKEIHRSMKFDERIAGIQTAVDQKIAELTQAKRHSAETISQRIRKAAQAPRIIPATETKGSTPKDEGVIPEYTDKQIRNLDDKDLDAALAQTNETPSKD